MNEGKPIRVQMNSQVSRNLKKQSQKSCLGPKLDAGGKPSTLFPPGGHVELIFAKLQIMLSETKENQRKKNLGKQN